MLCTNSSIACIQSQRVELTCVDLVRSFAVDNAAAPKPADPFLSLSRDHASAHEDEDTSDVAEKVKKRHKMIQDQLINLISKAYAIGHIGLDIGLNYTTEDYVYGVTMEKTGTPPVSQKYRLLLIKKEHLAENSFLSELNRGTPESERKMQELMGADCNEGYKHYKQDRLKKLQTLRKLYDSETRTNKKRLFLVGEVKIAVPIPGGARDRDGKIANIEEKMEKMQAAQEQMQTTQNEILKILRQRS